MLCTLCINSRHYELVAPDEPTQQPAQPPSTPRRPVAKRVQGIYVTLEWTQPDDDGETDITGYVIKYRGRTRLIVTARTMILMMMMMMMMTMMMKKITVVTVIARTITSGQTMTATVQ